MLPDSRQSGFAAEVLAATAGRGVDLVLNSLGDDFIAENVLALAHGGTYLDITKSEVALRHAAFASRPDLRYHQLDLAQWLQLHPQAIQPRLTQLLDRISSGQLAVLPVQTFELRDVVAAFRHMRSARHVGKIIVRSPANDERSRSGGVECGHDRCVTTTAANRFGEVDIRKDRSYLITGGLGGLGLEVARWLAQRGAGYIGLLARRVATPGEQEIVDRIAANGSRVELLRGDVEDRQAVELSAARLRQCAPLAGVFHLAGRLNDGLLTHQSARQFFDVLGPKVRGGWNLHQITRQDDLDYFVLFSSVSSVLGSAGQANHAAANAFLTVWLAGGNPRDCPL